MVSNVTKKIGTPVSIGFQKKNTEINTFLIGLLLPVSLLIIWEIAGRNGLLNPLLLPTPSAILDEYILLIQSGELFGHLQI